MKTAATRGRERRREPQTGDDDHHPGDHQDAFGARAELHGKSGPLEKGRRRSYGKRLGLRPSIREPPGEPIRKNSAARRFLLVPNAIAPERSGPARLDRRALGPERGLAEQRVRADLRRARARHLELGQGSSDRGARTGELGQGSAAAGERGMGSTARGRAGTRLAPDRTTGRLRARRGRALRSSPPCGPAPPRAGTTRARRRSGR